MNLTPITLLIFTTLSITPTTAKTNKSPPNTCQDIEIWNHGCEKVRSLLALELNIASLLSLRPTRSLFPPPSPPPPPPRKKK